MGCLRSQWRSTLPSLAVPRSPGSCVLLLDVASNRERRSAMTRHRPWCRTPPRNSVLWSPREPVSTSPSWCPSWSPPRSVWITQGGVHQVQDQPQEGQETCGQEVVLRSYCGIWSCLSDSLIQLDKLILTWLTMRMKTGILNMTRNLQSVNEKFLQCQRKVVCHTYSFNV